MRHRNGAVPELDVLQARALLRDTEATISLLHTGERQSLNALALLLGRAPSGLQDVVQGPGNVPRVPSGLALGVPVDLLRRRPDVRLAELRAAAQGARIGLAKSDLYPRFSLLGSIGFETSQSGGPQSSDAGTGDLFDSGSRRYSVGPAFSWPILNYGRLRNNVRVQDARFQQAALNYRNAVLKAAREVEDNLVAFLDNRQRANLLSQSVADADRSVELALINYREGSVTYQTVLDTQRFLLRQQDQHAATLGDVALSVVGTYKALGGGWEVQAGKALLDPSVVSEMRERTDWGEEIDSTHPEE